jgi:hypothetical protein
LALNVEDPNTIVEDLWEYYKQTARNWTEQAALLPSW